jgi:hypothetical protein
MLVVIARGRNWAALAAAELIEAGIGRYPICPRAERRASVESVEVAHDRDHRVLRGVGGVGVVAGDSAAHGMNAVVVTAQQLVECPTVSPLGCSHQLVVGELCCDGGDTTSRGGG